MNNQINRSNIVAGKSQGNVGLIENFMNAYQKLIIFTVILMGTATLGTAEAAPGDISTIAGRTNMSFEGDGGPAIDAEIFNPNGVAFDNVGNVYIADTLNHLIRKVDTLGVITTFAGTGVPGFSGDTESAIAAQLSSPSGLALDSAGNIYIADTGNNRIRKVDTLGVITTIAGNGTFGFFGDAVDATLAHLKSPSSVAVDGAGNVYIADRDNFRIRKVDTSGVITTIAGSGTFGFSGDNEDAKLANLSQTRGIAVDSSGNVYIADTNNHRIRKVDTLGVITTIAGSGTFGFSGDNGSATLARINSPYGLALDGTGNIYIADRSNHRIRKVNTLGNITTIAGIGTFGFSGDNGSATLAQLRFPQGVAVDSAGDIYIADTSNNRIRKVDTLGDIATFAGKGTTVFSGDGGPATSAEISSPQSIAVDSAGNVYIADRGNFRMRKVDTLGEITTVAGSGTVGFSGVSGPAIDAGFNSLSGLALDGTGTIYIADRGNNLIRKVDTLGQITTIAGNGNFGSSGDNEPAINAELNAPEAIAVDGAGNVYIADSNNNRIRKVDTLGVITTIAGNGTFGFSGDNGDATLAQLRIPNGVGVDSDGNVYIADSNNNRIRKVDTLGVITTIAGIGTAGFSGDNGDATLARINNPRGVAVDSAGNVYISDFGNRRIRKVDTLGIITTIAGNGALGFSGDGGPAVLAQLSNPVGIVVDSEGNIFISDSGNNRIRKVEGEISNLPPTADAGVDQNIRAGDLVQLSGDLSFDDNTPVVDLDFAWTILLKPDSSSAYLDIPSSKNPSFTADVAGDYIVQLIVTDEGGLSSEPDYVAISSNNLAPIADASEDDLVIVGLPVQLNGSGSLDPEGDGMSYEWQILSAPSGSLAALSDSNMSLASFTPDLVGEYEIQLTVSDFLGAGEPDTVLITSVSPESYAEIQIMDAYELVDDLGNNQATNKGNKQALLNHLTNAVKEIGKGKLGNAVQKLDQALERINGCALRGAADDKSFKNETDWILDCPEQLVIYDLVIDAKSAID